MGVALAFAASIAWGVADFLGGVTSRRLPALMVLAGQQITGLVIVVVVVAVVQASGPPGSAVLLAALSGVAQTVGMFAYYRALATGAMGVVAPISATGAVLPIVVGLAGGEDPTGLQAAGMLLAAAGVMAAAYQGGEADLGRAKTAVGVGMALIAAVALGSFFLLLDRATNHADLTWVVLVNRFGAVATLTVVALGLRKQLAADSRRLRGWRRTDPLLIVAIGSLGVSATFLFASATTHGLLSAVSVIGSLYPVTTVLIARVVLKERLRVAQRLGAAGALAGIALISV
jgi:drug/metabolite transporter (DMT)-like permease